MSSLGQYNPSEFEASVAQKQSKRTISHHSLWSNESKWKYNEMLKNPLGIIDWKLKKLRS